MPWPIARSRTPNAFRSENAVLPQKPEQPNPSSDTVRPVRPSTRYRIGFYPEEPTRDVIAGASSEDRSPRPGRFRQPQATCRPRDSRPPRQQNGSEGHEQGLHGHPPRGFDPITPYDHFHDGEVPDRSDGEQGYRYPAVRLPGRDVAKMCAC